MPGLLKKRTGETPYPVGLLPHSILLLQSAYFPYFFAAGIGMSKIIRNFAAANNTLYII